MKHRVSRALAALSFVGLMAVSAMWAVRFAQADAWSGQGTIEGLRQASRIVPDGAEYRLRLALSIGDEVSAESLALLRQAAALSPADARIWIELGLRYESLQNHSEAEKCLLHAAEVDRQYVPRWTLANYYLRQDNMANFWHWARSSAEVIPGDPVPLFRLCGRVTEDGNLMDRFALHSAELRSAYLAYLLEAGKLELGARVANGLVSEGSATAAPVLMDYCDRLLAGSRVEEALSVWNGLSQHGLIPFAGLDPARAVVLTNGDFSKEPTSRGFDWRTPAVEGVSLLREHASGGLRVTFSGLQPESCSPLAQTVPVAGGGRYALDVSYRTSGIQNDAGLSWQVEPRLPAQTPQELPIAASENKTWGHFQFVVPPGCRGVQLALAYRRTLGTMRIEGYIVLNEVRLRRMD
ncbi:MAG: hypothetical protein ABSC08_07400 [Bryobacteraceae bacterium]|jgi:tetratricopeptide (TPR) repeat protein